mgnify:CR=1 FL=1
MSEFFDDEHQLMDEQEFEESKEMTEGISINDPIDTLTLHKMVLVERGTTIQTIIEKFRAEGVACVLVGYERRRARGSLHQRFDS